MSVPRYTVRIQLDTTMPSFLKDMIYVYHQDYMGEPSIYAKEIYTLTPTKSNPHTDAYALNEEISLIGKGISRKRVVLM